jgi:hypothetical protein
VKKIPTLFVRDFANRGQITREHHPDVGWVVRGEGVATRKYDGTAALVRNGQLFKRYMLKPGKIPPAGFEAVELDEETGKTVGWVPVSDGPEDRWFNEALHDQEKDGTYELIGPKVQGNPEQTDLHELVAHADAERFKDVPTDYDSLREWLAGRDIEGIVWHHPDGRMAKIKLVDFGLRRQRK